MEKQYEIYEVTGELYKCDDNFFPNCLVFFLEWTANIGFGTLEFVYNNKTKTWSAETEHMDKEFCNAVLEKWLSTVLNKKENNNDNTETGN